MNDEDDKLIRHAKTVFDDSVDRLDGERLSKLNQARNRALEELDRKQPLASWLTLAPAGGLAALALVAVLVLRVDDASVEVPVGPTAAETDFELLINDDSLEMLEDLEFYSWLSLDELEDTEQTS